MRGCGLSINLAGVSALHNTAGIESLNSMNKFMTRSYEDEPRKQSRLKILYLQATSEVGGSDVSLLRIVEKLDKSRFEPLIILPADGPLVEKLIAAGGRVQFLPEMLKLTTRRGIGYLIRYILNYPRVVFNLSRFIRAEKVSIVHTNVLHNLYGFAGSLFAGRPHVWHVREIVWQSPVIRAVELFLARRFSKRVIVTSNAVAEMFIDKKGNLPSNVVKIPNSIDILEFNPSNDGSSIYSDLNIKPGTPIVGFVSRLDYWKGVDTFLQAAAICKAQIPEAHYLVAGGPIVGHESFADEIKLFAKNLGLNGTVHFSDWRYQPKDMPKIYAALSIFVLASKWPEPFGLVLLEAMATAKPVVATNHGGPKEICVQGETGILVPPDNAEAMSEAILSLLRDSQKARAMGIAGRHRVEQLFDRNKCIEDLEALYEKII
jgi:glycosyltransferase involved in cell wall biosynthesis